MAIYHCSVKIISRGQGRSAVAAAAYRSGSKLHYKKEQQMYDFSKKSGVIAQGIFLPKDAPKKYKDRETLWNDVEKIEKSSRAQLAREFEVALPAELDVMHQKTVIREFCIYLREQGMVCDAAIHDKGDGNPHAHIMTTMRSFLPDGSWAPKSKLVYDLDTDGNRIYMRTDKRGCKIYKNHKENYTDWDKKENIEIWRAKWAEICNRYLEKEQQIDHRSYARQGVDRIPTIHEGYAAREMEKRGEAADRCHINREINEANSKIVALTTSIEQAQPTLAALRLQIEQEKKDPYAAVRAVEKKVLEAESVANSTYKWLERELNAKKLEVKDREKELEERQEELSMAKVAMMKVRVVANYAALYEEYNKKVLGKKRFWDKHAAELSTYTAALDWLSERGYANLDNIGVAMWERNVEKEVQQAEEACSTARKDVEAVKADMDMVWKPVHALKAELRSEVERAGLDVTIFDYGEFSVEGISIEKLIERKEKEQQADRSPRTSPQKPFEPSLEKIKELIRDEFKDEIEASEGSILKMVATVNEWKEPDLKKELSQPASKPLTFAERLAIAQGKANKRNREQQRDWDRDDDFER